MELYSHYMELVNYIDELILEYFWWDIVWWNLPWANIGIIELFLDDISYFVGELYRQISPNCWWIKKSHAFFSIDLSSKILIKSCSKKNPWKCNKNTLGFIYGRMPGIVSGQQHECSDHLLSYVERSKPRKKTAHLDGIHIHSPAILGSPGAGWPIARARTDPQARLLLRGESSRPPAPRPWGLGVGFKPWYHQCWINVGHTFDGIFGHFLLFTSFHDLFFGCDFEPKPWHQEFWMKKWVRPLGGSPRFAEYCDTYLLDISWYFIGGLWNQQENRRYTLCITKSHTITLKFLILSYFTLYQSLATKSSRTQSPKFCYCLFSIPNSKFLHFLQRAPHPRRAERDRELEDALEKAMGLG